MSMKEWGYLGNGGGVRVEPGFLKRGEGHMHRGGKKLHACTHKHNVHIICMAIRERKGYYTLSP